MPHQVSQIAFHQLVVAHVYHRVILQKRHRPVRDARGSEGIHQTAAGGCRREFQEEEVAQISQGITVADLIKAVPRRAKVAGKGFS